MLIFMTHALVCFAAAEPSSWIDTARSRYSVAATTYDAASLQKTAEYITRQPAAEQQNPRTLLLLGLIYWRLELIAFCSNAPADITRHGKSALQTLDIAENAGADPYLTGSHKALACQLLATQGISSGATYGPRAAKELKKAQAANPKGYFSLFVEAINTNQAPSFAGGNPKKAVVLLEKLADDFPDSIDVKIHLSEAYSKVGRSEDASRIITPIVQKFPSNLLARKIAAKLPRR